MFLHVHCHSKLLDRVISTFLYFVLISFPALSHPCLFHSFFATDPYIHIHFVNVFITCTVHTCTCTHDCMYTCTCVLAITCLLHAPHRSPKSSQCEYCHQELQALTEALKRQEVLMCTSIQCTCTMYMYNVHVQYTYLHKYICTVYL